MNRDSSTERVQRILVGVDADGAAGDAIIQGFELALCFAGDVEFLHAIDLELPTWSTIAKAALDRLHQNVEVQARSAVIGASRAFVERSGRTIDDFSDRLQTVLAPPAVALCERAEETAADLIVIGPHERGALFDFGSTLRALVAATPVPMLVQSTPYAPLRRILVPIDGSEHSRQALEFATTLAGVLGGALTVLHALEPEPLPFGLTAEDLGLSAVAENIDPQRRAEIERIARATVRERVPWTLTCIEGAPIPTILDQATKHDLVLLGSHGRRGLMRTLLGSVAHGVLRASTRPTLVVPNPKRTWRLEPVRVAGPALSPDR